MTGCSARSDSSHASGIQRSSAADAFNLQMRLFLDARLCQSSHKPSSGSTPLPPTAVAASQPPATPAPKPGMASRPKAARKSAATKASADAGIFSGTYRDAVRGIAPPLSLQIAFMIAVLPGRPT
jgi:hypothetical protein